MLDNHHYKVLNFFVDIAYLNDNLELYTPLVEQTTEQEKQQVSTESSVNQEHTLRYILMVLLKSTLRLMTSAAAEIRGTIFQRFGNLT
jgi:hypothetical protein